MCTSPGEMSGAVAQGDDDVTDECILCGPVGSTPTHHTSAREFRERYCRRLNKRKSAAKNNRLLHVDEQRIVIRVS